VDRAARDWLDRFAPKRGAERAGRELPGRSANRSSREVFREQDAGWNAENGCANTTDPRIGCARLKTFGKIMAEARGYAMRDASFTGGGYQVHPYDDGLAAIAVAPDGARAYGSMNILRIKTAFTAPGRAKSSARYGARQSWRPRRLWLMVRSR
jgi:hypothetical protein